MLIIQYFNIIFNIIFIWSFMVHTYLSGADKQHEYAEPYTAFPSSRQVKEYCLSGNKM